MSKHAIGAGRVPEGSLYGWESDHRTLELVCRGARGTRRLTVPSRQRPKASPLAHRQPGSGSKLAEPLEPRPLGPGQFRKATAKALTGPARDIVGGHETKVFDKEVANTYVLARFVDAVLVLICDVEAKDLKFVDALVSAQGVTAIVVDPDPDATINATRTSQFPSQSLAN
ncbi:hypothetical protein PG995_010749 [Apiospora arundinis]